MNTPEGELKDMSLLLNTLLDLVKKVVGSEIELANNTHTPQLDSLDKALTQATKELSETSPHVPTPIEHHYVIAPSSEIRRRPRPAVPKVNGLVTSSPVSRKRPAATEKSPKRAKTVVPIDVAVPMGMMSLEQLPPSPSDDAHIMIEMYQISKEVKKEQAAVFARTEIVRLRHQEGWKMTGKCGNIKLAGAGIPFYPCVCCRSRLGKDAYENEHFKPIAHGPHHRGEDKDGPPPAWWGRNNLAYKSLVEPHRAMVFSLGIDLPICEPCYAQTRDSGFVAHGSFATAHCRCCLLPFANAVCYHRLGVAGAPRHVPLCSRCTELPALKNIIDTMTAKGLLEVDEHKKVIPKELPAVMAASVFCEGCGYHKTNSEPDEWLVCALDNCGSHICPRCAPPGSKCDSDGGLQRRWFCIIHRS